MRKLILILSLVFTGFSLQITSQVQAAHDNYTLDDLIRKYAPECRAAKTEEYRQHCYESIFMLRGDCLTPEQLHDPDVTIASAPPSCLDLSLERVKACEGARFIGSDQWRMCIYTGMLQPEP